MNRYGDFSEEDRTRIVRRIVQLRARFVQYKSSKIPAALRKALQIDIVKLELAVGAYWNDLNRLKQWHDISDKLHRSKIAAYTIKWLLHYVPIHSTLSPEEHQNLDEESQIMVVNGNCGFIVQVMFFTLDSLDPKEFQTSGRFHSLLRDLVYYMATDSYQEKMAAVLFEALLIASPEKNS